MPRNSLFPKYQVCYCLQHKVNHFHANGTNCTSPSPPKTRSLLTIQEQTDPDWDMDVYFSLEIVPSEQVSQPLK